jgi:hypothetical protein
MKSVLALLLQAAVLLTSCQTQTAGEEVVARWLEALSGATEDRGWSFLDPSAQDRYLDDESAYVADAADVDWAAVGFDLFESVEDDGIWTVFVRVDRGWAAVPAFMREQALVGVLCEDGQPTGFVVFAHKPMAGPPKVGAGADAQDTSCL